MSCRSTNVFQIQQDTAEDRMAVLQIKYQNLKAKANQIWMTGIINS